jgi:hypothetical protein
MKWESSSMRVREYRIGDPVVYRRTKHSTSPGPRAEEIDAAPKGDIYSYMVDKYWIVNDVLADGTIEVRTRRGKTRHIDREDACLRHASLIERIFKADRFPAAQVGHVVN